MRRRTPPTSFPSVSRQGLLHLRKLNGVQLHKDDPSIIEERRQALAAMIKTKTEESD
jgi:hypothetical protein